MAKASTELSYEEQLRIALETEADLWDREPVSIDRVISDMLEDIEPVVENRKVFVIDTEDRVEWYLSKLSEYQAEIIGIDQSTDALIARLEKQRSSIKSRVNTKIKALEYKFRHQVEEICKKIFGETGEKTHYFKWGTCSFRTTKGKIVIDSRELALKFAEDNCLTECVGVTKNIIVKPYVSFSKNYMLSHKGQLPPGLKLNDDETSFKVSTGTDDLTNDLDED